MGLNSHKPTSHSYLIRAILIHLALLPGVAVLAQNQILPDTLRFCQADSVSINAGSGYDAYEWSNGYTTQIAWFTQSGDYSLTVSQGDTLFITDDFSVIIVGGMIYKDNPVIQCGDTIQLKGSDPYYDYLWNPGNIAADSVLVFPRDTTIYTALIQDPGISIFYCIDSIQVVVVPVITLDSVIQVSIGCPGEDKAKIKLEVSGGYPPYDFDWPPGAIPLYEDPSFAIGLTDGKKKIVITDTIGCSLNETFNVKAHRLPDLLLNTDPSDTVYLQKPYITFTYENPLYDSLGVDTFYLNWWEWNFGDSIKSVLLAPTHAYRSTGSFTVILKFRTFYECEGSDTLQVEVKPVKLKLPMVITPNGDTYNDLFEIWEDTGQEEEGETFKTTLLSDNVIDLSEYYISNRLTIFNRWGQKVYEVDNYQNDWNAENLKDGVYFYILACDGEYQDDVYKGSFMLITGDTF